MTRQEIIKRPIPLLANRVGFWLWSVGIGVLPIIVWWGSNLSLEFVKKFYWFFLTLLAILIWSIYTFSARKLILPSRTLLVAGFFFTLAAVVATVFSPVPAQSWSGWLFENTTAVVWLLLILSMFVSAVQFSSPSRAFLFYSVFLISSLVVFLSQVLIWLSRAPGSINLIGRWHEFGLFVGLVAVVSASLLDNDKLLMPRWCRILAIVCFISSLAFLTIANFDLAWWLILVVAFVSLVRRRVLTGARLPLLVLSLFMILFAGHGSGLGQRVALVNDRLGIAVSDVRPSWTATAAVAKQIWSERPLFGNGPERFVDAWVRSVPAEQIAGGHSQLTEFSASVGWLPTVVINQGIVGCIAILAGILLLAIGVRQRSSPFGLAGLIYLGLVLLFYPPSSVLLVLTFVFIGVTLAGNRVISTKWARPVAVLFLILVVAAGFYTTMRFISFLNYRAGDFISAVRKSPADAYQRALSTQYLQGLNAQNFATHAPAALAAAQAAVERNPGHYRNWVALGDVYELLGLLNVEGAAARAQEAYVKARELNPLYGRENF